MRRFVRSRFGRVLVVAALGLAGVGVAGWLALPVIARVLIEREADARGIELDVEGVDVGGGSVELRGVRFSSPEDGARGRVDGVEVEATLVGLAWRGRGAVRAVRVSGAELELTLPLRERGGTGDGAVGERGARGRTLPALRVDRAEVGLRDEAGELARVWVETAVVDGARVELRAEAIEVGPPETRLASATRVAVEGELSPRRVSRVEVDALDLTGLADEARVEAFLDRARRARGASRLDPASAEEDEPARLGGYGRLLERLAGDFELVLGRAALPHRDGEAFVLEDSGVARRSGSRVRVYGGGRGPHEARAEFDVEVDAVALRASGKVEIERLGLDAIAGLVPAIPWHEPERGRVSASVHFEASSPTVIAFSGTLDVEDLGVDSERIASEPIVGLDFSLAGAGEWDIERRRLSVERGTFGLGEAEVELEGHAIVRRSAWALTLQAKLPPTPCDDAVHAFPSAILGSAEEFELRGTLAGRLRLEVEAERPEDLALEIRVDDRCRFVDWPSHADPARFRSLFLHEALDPSREPFDFETGPRTEVWTDLSEVSPYLVAAVLAHEDAAFFRHGGFSTFAIRGSLARNLAAGRFERGASTLSMQLAKNLFLNREKVLVRKLREVIYTWWLEKGFGKESILELYLNVVEFGPYIYGVRNASLHYFGREPSELSPAEATFLANILPRPKAGAFHYERGELSKQAKNKIAWLLENMKKRELLSEEAVEYGLSEIETFSFHEEGAPRPLPRTLPPTHPLFESQRPERYEGPMHEDGFDPWGLP